MAEILPPMEERSRAPTHQYREPQRAWYRCRSYHSQLHGANGRRLLPAKAHDEQVGIGGRSTWRLPAYRSRRLRLDRKALWRKAQLWQLYLLYGRSLPPRQPLEADHQLRCCMARTPRI